MNGFFSDINSAGFNLKSVLLQLDSERHFGDRSHFSTFRSIFSPIRSDCSCSVQVFRDQFFIISERLQPETVNQDDISVRHLFYADQKGSPGTDLTFFEFPGTQPTRKGTNSISRVSLRVPADRSLAFWARRFDALHVAHREITMLFGHKALEFEDFDGTPLRLISDEKNAGVPGGIPWTSGPVPVEQEIYGLGTVTHTVSRLELIRTFLQDVPHFREVAREVKILCLKWEKADTAPN